MSTKQWLAVAALALLPIAASAQQEQARYNPSDANAPVKSAPYESAFNGFRAASDNQESADKVWRTPNDEMGKLGGHAGQMKPVETQPAAASGTESAPA